MNSYKEIKNNWYEANRSWIDASVAEGDYEYVDMMWECSCEYAEIEKAESVMFDRFFGFGTENDDVDNAYAIDWVENEYIRIAQTREYAMLSSDKATADYAWEAMLSEM